MAAPGAAEPVERASVAWPLAAAGRWLGARLEAEQDRLALWLPVAFGSGIGVYLVALSEPSVWLGPAIAWAGIIIGLLARGRLWVAVPALAAIAAGLGLALAQWHATTAAAPVLARPMDAEVSGRVIAVELRETGSRVTLDQVAIEGLARERTPERVRIRIRAEPPMVPGDRIAVRAKLMPPPAPAMPGAFDFQRQAWFERLGAVGYATRMPQVLNSVERGAGWRLWLQALRTDATARIAAAIPGDAGAIAAALMTGEMGLISKEAMEAMRDSGLAHLLSISGLHVSFVAGIVFFVVRFGFALWPAIALRYPTKKWAALAAFAAITFYTLFSGASVPTQRSWLMASIVLFAVVVDRTAISMRLIAWAAVAVLVASPESLVGASFQMSFAAVVALIACYEVVAQPMARLRAGRGLIGRGALGLASVALTTLIAGTASAAFALYHFNRFTLYGLVANMIAVPLTGMWVMPWAMVAFLLLPFGWEWLPLQPMGWGVEGVIWVANWVAGWEGSVSLFPAMPAYGMAILTLGGLWLCLWRTRWRLAGIPVVIAGLLTTGLHRGPDILVADDGGMIAVRGADGRLNLGVVGKASKMVRDTWLRRDGQEEAEFWPALGESADGRLSCDPLGCVYRARGQVVALAKTAAALADDCTRAAVVVAVVPVRGACQSANAVIDRFSLWREGGHAIWLSEQGRPRIETVHGIRGERPWVPARPAPRTGGTARAE